MAEASVHSEQSVRNVKRFAAIAGIVSVVFYLLGDALIFDLPPIEASASTLASYAASHQTQLLAFVYVWGATVAAALCFLVGIWSLLRRSDRVSELLATLGLGSGFVIWAIVLAGLAPVLAVGYLSTTTSDPTTAKVLVTLALLGATLSAFPTVISVGAFSALILRTGALARWLGWSGVIVIAAHLVAAGAFAHEGFFSASVVSVFVAPPLYFLWVLLVSVALLRRDAAALVK